MLQADVQYNHIGKNAAFQHTKHFGYNVYKKEATFWNEPQKLDKKRIKRPQRSESCTAQGSGRLVLI